MRIPNVWILLLVMLPIVGSGQHFKTGSVSWHGSYSGVSVGVESYLLDDYPGADVAFSLRYLSSSWVGNDVILARRSSDNAELGCRPIEISDGTLATWAGTNDVHIKTWYDQSGNGNHATQTNLLEITAQPKIIESSAVILDQSGNLAIEFNRYSNLVLSSNVSGRSVFMAIDLNSFPAGTFVTSEIVFNSSGGLSGSFVFFRNDTYAVSMDGSIGDSGTWFQNSIEKATGGNVGNASGLVRDAMSLQTIIFGAGDPASGISRIGAFTAGQYWSYFKASEYIIYPDDKSSERTNIEESINAHYSIY